MSDNIIGNGTCLCGGVHVTAKNISNSVGACHCGMCRKWCGGPLMAMNCGSNVTFDGQNSVSVFNSSAWAERGFCKTCGSHLFYRLKESDEYIVPAGLFDNQEAFVFDTQVFIDRKPSFYSFENQTNDMTEAEIFEKYGPQ